MPPTTPRNITGSIRRFIASLESAGTPVVLPFIATSPDYRPGYCLSNCEAEAKRASVVIMFGWVLWELRSKSFIEAEFHAVIRRGNELQDITPRVDGERLVLFVPDRARRATRRDEHTWDTWANHKKIGGAVEATRPILLQDPTSNVWA
jgi:hypothetical protein